jgi:hypothetical protein
VIKIVYRDLSPGLHASAHVSGRHTVISLLPGLTPDQRRAALRRIRHSGRMGHGPRVSAPGLALALGRDRIKAITCTGAAVVRLHPAGSTLPVVLLSAAAVIFVLMATVSIHVLPGPKSSDQSPVVGGVTPGPASSASGVSPSLAPSIAIPGHSRSPGQDRNRLAAHQPSSGGSSASGGTVGTSGGVTGFGSRPGLTGTGTGLVTVTSGRSGGSGGSGAGTSSGSGGTGRSGSGSGSGSAGSGSGGSGSGSAGSGASAGSGGSGAGPGTTGGGSGTTSGSGGSGTTGSGSGSGSGSGGSGSGGSGSGSGSGGSGSGSSGGSGSTGSTGSGGSGTSGGGSTGSGSGSPAGSGGLCLNLLGVLQACIG